jgi:hypothetical protein
MWTLFAISVRSHETDSTALIRFCSRKQSLQASEDPVMERPAAVAASEYSFRVGWGRVGVGRGQNENCQHFSLKLADLCQVMLKGLLLSNIPGRKQNKSD